MPGQVWVTNSLGGYTAAPKLSQSMRMSAAPKYAWRQFVRIESDFSAGKGESILFNKMSRINTRGGTLSETSTMPKAGYTWVQDSATVTEYGNSVPWTKKLDILSSFDINDSSHKVLRDDMADVIDRAVGAVYKTAKFVAVCTKTDTTLFYTNGAATAGADCNMSDKNVRDIVDYMKIAKIPKFGDSSYRAVVSINSQRGVYDYLQAIMQYTTPEFTYNSELGRYYDTRFIEENNVLSNAKGSGSSRGEAVFFGDDSVVEAIALPEELRKQTADFGRTIEVAWYYLGGFKKIWDYSTDTEEHIVYVTSA